jgi:hypothetical protein
VDPINSKYDDHPFDPNAPGDDGAKPDLGNTDSPELKVAWETRPSFNTAPTDIDEGASGAGSQDAAGDANDFKVSFEALGAQVNTMLDRARGLVTQYESLRSKVLGSEGTVFGQKSMLPGGTTNNYDSLSHTWTSSTHDAVPTVFAKPAQQFADQMNPVRRCRTRARRRVHRPREPLGPGLLRHRPEIAVPSAAAQGRHRLTCRSRVGRGSFGPWKQGGHRGGFGRRGTDAGG